VGRTPGRFDRGQGSFAPEVLLCTLATMQQQGVRGMRAILTAVLFAVIATTMMGIGVTAVLSMPGYTSQMVMIAAATGFVLAAPTAWFVASAILRKVRT